RFDVCSDRVDENARELSDRGVDARADVDRGIALLRLRRQYDGARDVLDMDEVHRLLAGSVDDRRFTAKQPVHEMVDDARVIGGRLLTWTVDVEEAQRHPTEAFGALVIAEQILASALGDAIGREWAELI